MSVSLAATLMQRRSVLLGRCSQACSQWRLWFCVRFVYKPAGDAMSYEIIWEPDGVIKRFLGHVDEIAAIDQAASISNRNIRIAVVATHPEILELADHYARSPMNVYPTRIFPTMAEGRVWLGIPEPYGVPA